MIAQQNLGRDRPYTALVQHIVLAERKMFNSSRFTAPENIHLRHAASANPGARPFLQRSSRGPLQSLHQIAPRGVPILVLFQIDPQSATEMLIAHDEGELPQQSRRFGIHDGSIRGLCILQIIDVLVDRSGSESGIDSISRGLHGQVEALPDVFLWFEPIERAIRHILRETLLQP